jgi:hypothetical protein
MSDEHSGFIWDVKHPTQEGYVACLVITPLHRGGGADTAAKVERNVGRSTAVQIATKLLRACNAPAELLAQVQDLDETGRAAQI